MTELIWPPNIVPQRFPRRIIDSTSVAASPVTGYSRTASNYGVRRWGVSVEHDWLQTSNRAYILSLVAALRGRSNRLYIPCFDYRKRGAFSAPEVVPNNDFSNGTTGWSAGSEGSIAVSNRVMRITRISNVAGGGAYAAVQSVTTVAWAPYVWRMLTQNIRGIVNCGATVGGNSVMLTGSYDTGATGAMRRLPFMATSTSGVTLFADNLAPLVSAAGDFFEVAWSSCSRCLLVDNQQNAFLQSNTLSNAAWTKTRCSVSNDLFPGPNGVVDGDKLQEDSSASNSHFIAQTITRTSAAEDWCVEGYFQRAVGTRDVALIVSSDAGPTNYLSCPFTLTNGGGGTAGTPINNGTATNGRAFIKYLGQNIYYCALAGRLPATTSVVIHARMLSGGTDTYTGDGASALGINDFGAAQSSFPFRIARTTTTAVTNSANPQTGSALYVKGGRTPTEGVLAGALLRDDMVEIVTATGSQLVKLTADLDLDAAGLGYLQFEPGLRSAPADNAAIIVNEPMGRYMLADDTIEWSTMPGINVGSNASLNFVEAVQ